jgi:hypothetical protein
MAVRLSALRVGHALFPKRIRQTKNNKININYIKGSIFYDIMLCSHWKSANILVEHIASIFWVEEYAVHVCTYSCRTCSCLCSCYSCYLLHASFLLGLFFSPEYGCRIFLQNVCWLLMNYTALIPEERAFQKPLLWEPQIINKTKFIRWRKVLKNKRLEKCKIKAEDVEKRNLMGKKQMVSCILKMETACSTETSVNIYQTTRHHIPEDSNLQ